jgi:hypothetical protein
MIRSHWLRTVQLNEAPKKGGARKYGEGLHGDGLTPNSPSTESERWEVK